MKKLKRGYLLCLTTLFLTLSMRSYAYGEWRLVPKGYITEEAGYFGNQSDMAEAVTALQSRREERDHWRAAYSDLRTEFITTTEEQNKKLAVLADEINNVNKAWKAAIAGSRSGNWILPALFGILGFAVGR